MGYGPQIQRLNAEKRIQIRALPYSIHFKYVNWRGELHEYKVRPEMVELGPYDASGINEQEHNWVLHAQVVMRDGEPRPGRRTFLIEKMEDTS